jgi:hypothetical protein
MLHPDVVFCAMKTPPDQMAGRGWRQQSAVKSQPLAKSTWAPPDAVVAVGRGPLQDTRAARLLYTERPRVTAGTA